MVEGSALAVFRVSLHVCVCAGALHARERGDWLG